MIFSRGYYKYCENDRYLLHWNGKVNECNVRIQEMNYLRCKIDAVYKM